MISRAADAEISPEMAESSITLATIGICRAAKSLKPLRRPKSTEAKRPLRLPLGRRRRRTPVEACDLRRTVCAAKSMATRSRPRQTGQPCVRSFAVSSATWRQWHGWRSPRGGACQSRRGSQNIVKKWFTGRRRRPRPVAHIQVKKRAAGGRIAVPPVLGAVATAARGAHLTPA